MQAKPSLPRRADDAVLPELDLRWLPSPEPMLRALAAADALLPGQAVQVLTPNTADAVARRTGIARPAGDGVCLADRRSARADPLPGR